MTKEELKLAQRNAAKRQYRIQHTINEFNRVKDPVKNKETLKSKKDSVIYYYDNNSISYSGVIKGNGSRTLYVADSIDELKKGNYSKSSLTPSLGKVSMNQVKEIYGNEYKRYWTYGGEIYGVKPGRVDRLDTGTAIATNLYDVKGYDSSIYTNNIAMHANQTLDNHLGHSANIKTNSFTYNIGNFIGYNVVTSTRYNSRFKQFADYEDTLHSSNFARVYKCFGKNHQTFKLYFNTPTNELVDVGLWFDSDLKNTLLIRSKNTRKIKFKTYETLSGKEYSRNIIASKDVVCWASCVTIRSSSNTMRVVEYIEFTNSDFSQLDMYWSLISV